MILAYDRLVRSEVYQTEFMTGDNGHFIIALADGMGGHCGGEVASELVLSNLKYYISDLPRTLSANEIKEYMTEWLHSANNIVNSQGITNPSLHEMGTTLVGVIYYEGHYFWMNCGDSRLYRLRNNLLEQLTTDHSLNTIIGEEKHSNIITNCIGAGIKNLYMDMVEFTEDLQPDDIYMLCSDGLTDMLPNMEIERLLCHDATADKLCEAAINAGGFDNVSVVIFKNMG